MAPAPSGLMDFMDFNARKFGSLLRQYREGNGLSQEQLASLVGVHRTYVGKVERGEKDVSLRTAMKFARALGVGFSKIIANYEQRGSK